MQEPYKSDTESEDDPSLFREGGEDEINSDSDNSDDGLFINLNDDVVPNDQAQPVKKDSDLTAEGVEYQDQSTRISEAALDATQDDKANTTVVVDREPENEEPKPATTIAGLDEIVEEDGSSLMNSS